MFVCRLRKWLREVGATGIHKVGWRDMVASSNEDSVLGDNRSLVDWRMEYDFLFG